jgi:hypothetical protein
MFIVSAVVPDAYCLIFTLGICFLGCKIDDLIEGMKK